jgi:hypothetical protein
MRHDLYGKPIKESALFKLYQSAYNELLALHSSDNLAKNTLVCELVVEKDDDSIVPDSWIDCNMLSPDEDGSGEIKEYGMDFVPWVELIDCPVSEESLSKYGELLCAAELLWEITFDGFTTKKVDDEKQRLLDRIDYSKKNPDSLIEWNPDNFKPNPQEVADKKAAITEWLSNAPELVKQSLFGHIAADVCSRDEDVDDITVAEVLARLKDTVDSNGGEQSDIVSMLHSMLGGLDVDERFLLVQGLYKGNEVEEVQNDY